MPMESMSDWLSLCRNKENRQGKKRQPGSAKGILTVLSEDNEHLNDFREYMS